MLFSIEYGMYLLLILCLILASGSLGQDYGDALRKSILFLQAQRSGDFEDNDVPFRRSAFGYDGSDVERDLSGGWFDAGDHVKFGFPMAGSATIIAWSLLDARQGYEQSGAYESGIASLRWVTDYFHKCTVDLANEQKFYFQCADGYEDHSDWNRPESQSANGMFRPSFAVTPEFPGSDVAGETAAAMAAAGLVFKDYGDEEYGDQLIQDAVVLFEFANAYRGKYSDSFPDVVGEFYGSDAYEDELCNAALWLYRATDDENYLSIAMEFYNPGAAWALSWDQKGPITQLLAYQLTDDNQYLGHIDNFIANWKPGGSIQYTPGGLAWRDMWGANRYAANAAFIAIMRDVIVGTSIDEATWGKTQIDYILGANPLGISYQVGYGDNSPRKPHHRAASCNPNHDVVCNWDDFHSEADNPSELVGAVVGGPDENDQYNDERDDYTANEVTTDYNAGFQGALAGLVQLGLQTN